MLVRISTINGCAVVRGTSVRAAKSIARAWMRGPLLGRMGGGRNATVEVAAKDGRLWHRVGMIGNPSDA